MVLKKYTFGREALPPYGKQNRFLNAHMCLWHVVQKYKAALQVHLVMTLRSIIGEKLISQLYCTMLPSFPLHPAARLNAPSLYLWNWLHAFFLLKQKLKLSNSCLILCGLNKIAFRALNNLPLQAEDTSSHTSISWHLDLFTMATKPKGIHFPH